MKAIMNGSRFNYHEDYMKYVLVLFASLFLMACETNIDPNTEVNVKAVIVKINQNDAILSQGKYTTPALCNTALFKHTMNNLHFTFTSCGNCVNNNYTCTHSNGGKVHEVNLNDAWVYGHNIGDTVTFKYIHRSRYFVVKKQ